MKSKKKNLIYSVLLHYERKTTYLQFPLQVEIKYFMKKVKNIIFDFGNVLLNLDMKATENQLVALLGGHYKFSEEKNEYPAFFEDYEVGKMGEEGFLSGLQQMTDKNPSQTDLKSAWNAMLLNVPSTRLEMLLRLKKKYRIFLLSNTNKTHIDYVMNYLDAEYDIKDWDTRYFEKTYYSHLVKMRKPDPAIYNFVLKDAGINAEETLFIDDNPANIETAAALGWQTILHNDGRDITTVLQNY
ncbi:MAG: FMN phosphatase YigB (HAD superfamily) [Saprospiraceae bacterium]